MHALNNAPHKRLAKKPINSIQTWISTIKTFKILSALSNKLRQIVQIFVHDM